MAADIITFKVDARNALLALRRAPKAVRAECRKELVVLGKSVVTEARKNMLSGMKEKGKTGYRWGYKGGTGVYMQAMASDITPNPKSWAGAAEGGDTGTVGFRHPVWAHGPRKTWAWGPGRKGTQAPRPALHDAWAKNRAVIIPKMEYAVEKALRESGFAD